MLVTKTSSKDWFVTTVLREVDNGFDTVVLTDINGKEHTVKEYNDLCYILLLGVTHATVTQGDITTVITTGDGMPD